MHDEEGPAEKGRDKGTQNRRSKAAAESGTGKRQWHTAEAFEDAPRVFYVDDLVPVYTRHSKEKKMHKDKVPQTPNTAATVASSIPDDEVLALSGDFGADYTPVRKQEAKWYAPFAFLANLFGQLLRQEAPIEPILFFDGDQQVNEPEANIDDDESTSKQKLQMKKYKYLNGPLAAKETNSFRHHTTSSQRTANPLDSGLDAAKRQYQRSISFPSQKPKLIKAFTYGSG